MRATKTSVTRYHDISCGHRVVGHEGSCSHLHGHNYRIHFTCANLEENLDSVGRVVDFSVVKYRLCLWLEDHWDHHFLVWNEDPLADQLLRLDETVYLLPFNPTAENMARHLVLNIGPEVLRGTMVVLTKVVIEETSKCSATFELRI